MENRIRALRKAKRISQVELAELLHVHQTAVSQWENGKTFPDIENLKRMSEIFGVPIDDIINDADINKIQPTVNDDELDKALVDELIDLTPSEVQRVKDFVSGLKASRKE